MTYTFALLQLPNEMFDLIQQKLKDAGYDHAILRDDGETVLDMHGIALSRETPQ